MIVCLTLTAEVSLFDQFIDQGDGKADISQWLSDQTGFLPVPAVISDPAVGYGGLAVAFLYDHGEAAHIPGTIIGWPVVTGTERLH